MKAFARACVVSTLLCSAIVAHAADFSVVPDTTGGLGNYAWSIGIEGAAATSNPPLYLARGSIYTFDIAGSSVHPFWFKTVPSIGSGNAYSDGLSDNGVITPSMVSFDVPSNAPETLYYDCGNHPEMTGPIHIVVFRDGFD